MYIQVRMPNNSKTPKLRNSCKYKFAHSIKSIFVHNYTLCFKEYQIISKNELNKHIQILFIIIYYFY